MVPDDEGCVEGLLFEQTNIQLPDTSILSFCRHFNSLKVTSDINSILAVIYLTKLQNLINLPVMNCSMSSFPYSV
jgi:hypothetical protein